MLLILTDFKISAGAFKKSKTNMTVVQMLFFFVSAWVIHSLVERVTLLRGNKDKNIGNKDAYNLVKIYKHRLLPPHSQRSMYREMKEEITSQKNNYSKSEKTGF